MTCDAGMVEVAGACVSLSLGGGLVEGLLMAFVAGFVAGAFLGGVLSGLAAFRRLLNGL